VINIEEYEETTRQYQTAIKWYRDKVFQNAISESALNSIEKCYENYQYSIDRNIKFEKRARCKNNCCPICNTKYKANKYFEIVGKLQNINHKYLLFSLTLNGKNVEINHEELKKEIEENNSQFNRLIKYPKLKKVITGYLKVIEIAYIPERNSFLPHLHIILFTIKGIYKHFKIRELKKLIEERWNELKGFKANTYLKKLGTEEKINKCVSYLTTSEKKRLSKFFNEDKKILATYLKSIKRKRLYIWSNLNRLESDFTPPV